MKSNRYPIAMTHLFQVGDFAGQGVLRFSERSVLMRKM